MFEFVKSEMKKCGIDVKEVLRLKGDDMGVSCLLKKKKSEMKESVNCNDGDGLDWNVVHSNSRYTSKNTELDVLNELDELDDVNDVNDVNEVNDINHVSGVVGNANSDAAASYESVCGQFSSSFPK